MLPLNPALQDFPSDSVCDQFDKVHSGSYSVPTSPKIHELRTRHDEFHAKIGSQTEKQAHRG
jgi:hypothetical protein